MDAPRDSDHKFRVSRADHSRQCMDSTDMMDRTYTSDGTCCCLQVLIGARQALSTSA